MGNFEKLFDWKTIYRFLETNVLKIIFAFAVFKIAGILKKYVDNTIKIVLEKSKMDKSVASFLRSSFSVLYYIILGYLLIGFLGINLTSITTFLGAAGIVLGFAFKETLGNF